MVAGSQAALSSSAGLVSGVGVAPSGPSGVAFPPAGFAPSGFAPDGSQVELGTGGSVTTGRLTAKNTCTCLSMNQFEGMLHKWLQYATDSKQGSSDTMCPSHSTINIVAWWPHTNCHVWRMTNVCMHVRMSALSLHVLVFC